MSILIDSSRFDVEPNGSIDLRKVKRAITMLQRLPPLEIDTETVPDARQSVTILQRENGFIDSAVESELRRFFGTRKLRSCLFIVFTITRGDLAPNYFGSHVDVSTNYKWDTRFEGFKGCEINAVIMGSCPVSEGEEPRELYEVLIYLLELSKKYNLDIRFTQQCILQNFVATEDDRPRDYTYRFLNRISVAYKRLFHKTMPAEFEKLAFPDNSRSSSQSPHDLPRELRGFADFLLKANAVEAETVASFREMVSHFGRSEEAFSAFVKALFTEAGFYAARKTLETMGAGEGVKFQNFLFDIETGKVIPVLDCFPVGDYGLEREILTTTPTDGYREAYCNGSYTQPTIPDHIKHIYSRHAGTFRSLEKGVKLDEIACFLRELGWPIEQLSPMLINQLSWLAHRFASSELMPARDVDAGAASAEGSKKPATGIQSGFFVSPKVTARKQQQNRIDLHLRYLNRASGEIFTLASTDASAAAKGTTAAVVYTNSDEGQLRALQSALTELNITSEIDGRTLTVAKITDYTAQLRAAVQPKP